MNEIKEFEMNLRDGKEYERWKAEMNEKDEIERIEHFQKKKIEMELAREDAIEAQKRKERENKLLVKKMKEDAGIEWDKKMRDVEEDWKQKKEIVETVQS